MAIKFHLIKAGDMLWQRGQQNNRAASWPVKIISIDYEKETAVISWNGNPAQISNKRNIEKLFRTQKKEEKLCFTRSTLN